MKVGRTIAAQTVLVKTLARDRRVSIQLSYGRIDFGALATGAVRAADVKKGV
jgi:hypothetical protein